MHLNKCWNSASRSPTLTYFLLNPLHFSIIPLFNTVLSVTQTACQNQPLVNIQQLQKMFNR
jgi:hypothetical protein